MKLTNITKSEWTTYVGLLTLEQKESITGQMYTEDSFFNPIEDADDNWVISVEEMDYCTNPEFMWVKDLPLIEYKSKPEIP